VVPHWKLIFPSKGFSGTLNLKIPGVEVTVGVGLKVGVKELVGVGVIVGVKVRVGVGVIVGEAEGVAEVVRSAKLGVGEGVGVEVMVKVGVRSEEFEVWALRSEKENKIPIESRAFNMKKFSFAAL